MRRNAFLAAVLMMAVTPLVGCGGGAGGSNDDIDIDRILLSGSATGSPLTSKKWRTVALKVNDNYIGTGADQPCPVEVQNKNGIDSTSCDPTEYLELRSDGKSRAFSGGALSDFTDLWQLEGPTFVTTNQGGGTVIASYTLSDAGVVSGRQRLRLRTVSETEPDGSTLRSGEVGFEYVIEELP